MPGDATEPQPPPGTAGATRSSIGAHFQTYLKARFELVSLESKEALQVGARKFVLGVALATVAFFAYALVLTAAVALLGRWLATSWPDLFGAVGWVVAALAFGLLHVIAAAVLVVLLRRKSTPPLFEYTRSEFEKDREWLQKNPPGNANGN